MDRRIFTKNLLGLMVASTLPKKIQANSSIGDQSAFLEALRDKPWLIGYLGTRKTEIEANVRIISGYIPKDFKGLFLRNGPAMHNLGKERFNNWLDAPGMIQRFQFANDQILHQGRMVETIRNNAETEAQKILFSAFGTHNHRLSSGGSADGQNVGNINLLEHAGELLALWEGGSAHVIDPDTLKTKGRKDWSNQTRGLPFGAHPRRDQDGSIWNIGYSVYPSVLILYHISANGTLLKTQILPQQTMPMIHDFLITETKIVIVMPPFRASNTNYVPFLSKFEWNPTQPAELLIIDKNDLTEIKYLEIDPFWVFHFGNAYDLSANEIGFDMTHHVDPSFMTHDATAVMDGSWDGTFNSQSCYAQIRIDLNKNSAILEKSPELGQTEFIQIDNRENLNQHRYSLMLSVVDESATFGFNRLVLLDHFSGNYSYFEVSSHEILEEHLIVPKINTEDDFWIIGTTLDWYKGISSISIYDGKRLSEGPVMKAETDLALPLGLHGTFIPLRKN